MPCTHYCVEHNIPVCVAHVNVRQARLFTLLREVLGSKASWCVDITETRLARVRSSDIYFGTFFKQPNLEVGVV
jgi:hypothetical protein